MNPESPPDCGQQKLIACPPGTGAEYCSEAPTAVQRTDTAESPSQTSPHALPHPSFPRRTKQPQMTGVASFPLAAEADVESSPIVR